MPAVRGMEKNKGLDVRSIQIRPKGFLYPWPSLFTDTNVSRLAGSRDDDTPRNVSSRQGGGTKIRACRTGRMELCIRPVSHIAQVALNPLNR